MAPIEFSSSDSETSGSQDGEDWEKAAKMSKELAKKQEEEKAKLQAEQEAARRRQELRGRERVTYEGDEPEDVTEEAAQRAAFRLREQQSLEQARKFLGDADDSSSEEGAEAKKQQQALARDYAVENDFMAAGAAELSSVPKTATIDTMQPVTIEDFEKLGNMIATKVVSTLRRSARDDNDVMYMAMLKKIVEGALEPMYPEDAKELGSVCNVISAVKFKEEMDKKKKKRGGAASKPAASQSQSKKPQLYTGGSAARYGKLDADDDFI